MFEDDLKLESKLEIVKVFDINIKNEKEIKSVYIDENKYLRNLFFLSNNKKVYFLNILTKELEEFNFSRGHQVVHITGNNNNTFLIIIFKNCKIYSMDLSSKSIFYFKNLQSVPINLNEEGKENIFSPKLKFFANENLSKAILYTGEEIIIWFRHQIKYNMRKNIKELTGHHIYIQLQEEKKSFIKEKHKYIDNLVCFFNNDIFQGSAINIFYFMVFKIPKTNLFKLVIISYTFFFNKESMFNCVDNDDIKEKYLINNEIKKKFSTKYSFTYLMNINDDNNSKDNLEKIITKQNRTGIYILIGINFNNDINNILILFLTDSYRFFSAKISKLFPVKKFKMKIEDLAFVNNDYYILVYFVNGYFVLLNTNFQIVKFYDSTNSFSFFEKTNNIYIFNSFLSDNLCKSDNTNNENKTHFNIITNSNRIISYEEDNLNDNSKEKCAKYYDFIIIYTDFKIIGFHLNVKGLSYIDGLLRKEVKDFDDIVYFLQFLQLNDFDDNKKGFLFDKVHNYLVLNFGQIFQSLKAVINPLFTETDIEQNMNDNLNSDMSNTNILKNIFIKFLNIYRYLNIINYSPLSLISYFIVLTSDFFLFLLSQKDVWIGFLLVELGEKYLLHKLKLRNYKNNTNDAKYLQGKASFMIFNPNFLQASSVKGYNRINNFSLFSKLRLLIIFFCLMEFRNNQARNINVLYFVLAKLVVDRLKKENLLDDLNLMIKVVIRNWKYLKSENMKSGEEYILNSFSMNQKADTLALLLHTNNFITSNYIGRKMVSRVAGNADNLTAVRNTKSRFDFFNDFYSLDELTNFNNFISNYCSGQDNILSREFNYFNHLGIIQKWMTYFSNFLYPELFQDYKQYINTHLKQTISNNIKKKPENTSQDEKNLTKMIFFNLYIFMNILIQFNKDVFKAIINYDPNKKIKFFKVVLPPDLPYLTSEFYAIIYNIIEKNENSKANKKNIFLKEINDIYCQLWDRYKKEIQYDINNAFDFCHFLMKKGFKYYLNESQILSNYIENTNENSEENTMMYYLFSLLEFSIIIIHKNDLLGEIDTIAENCFIFEVSKILPDKFKKNIYELCFIVFTGHVRDYIYRQIGGGKNETLKPQEEYNFNLCVNFLKTIFNNYISEENPCVYENIVDVIQILPDFMKLQFIDEGLEKLFSNIYNNYGKNIFDTKNILNEKNYLYFNEKGEEQFIKDQKISEVFYNIIFYDKKNKYNEFNILLSNAINLIFNGSKYFEFELEKDSNKILNIMKNNVKEVFFDEIIYGKINEFKTIYKDSEYITKLVLKIKITIIKIFHVLCILFLKFKLLKLNLKINQIEILQYYILLLLLVENENTYSNKIDNIYNCLKFVINNNNSELFHKGIVDILININLGFIFKQLEPNNTFKELEKFIGEKHKNLMDLYSYTISNNINIFSKLKGKFKDEQNKFTLFFSNINYIKLLNEIYIMTNSESISHQNKEKNNNKIYFKEQREIYKILLEKYYNLTGFNVNMKIEFEEDWYLSINNPIYNLIISDKFSGRKFYNKNLFESIISDKTKQYPLELPNFLKQKEEHESIKNISEKEIKKSKEIKENEDEEIKLYKFQFKNKKRCKNLIKMLSDKYNKFEVFSLLMKKIILNKFRNQLFICFKRRNEILNLEKLEIIRIDTENKTKESVTLQEKYVTLNDYYHKDDYYNYLSQIKPFSVVRINKLIPGNASKSKFFKELLKNKNTKHLGNKIQEKLMEIQEKIKEFEDFNALIEAKLFNKNKDK